MTLIFMNGNYAEIVLFEKVCGGDIYLLKLILVWLNMFLSNYQCFVNNKESIKHGFLHSDVQDIRKEKALMT